MSDVMPSDHGDALDFLQRIAQTTSSRGVTLSWNGLCVGAARPGFTSPQLATAVRTPAVQFGTGDIALLNCAYAHEQLESAFFKQVMTTPFSGMTASEATLLTGIHAHEALHCDSLRRVLASAAMSPLTVSFRSVDFNDRESVLRSADALERLGLSAYQSANRRFVHPICIMLANKFVLVESRHASTIRNMMVHGTAPLGNPANTPPSLGTAA